MDEPSYIVFLCFGDQGFFHECSFALLSLCRLYSDGEAGKWQVYIYTDNPDWFTSFKDCPLNIHCLPLEGNTIKRWRGEIDYLYRVKTEMLLDFTKNRSGNILYLDTDVVFANRPDTMMQNIAGGKLYMHLMEGRISERSSPMQRKLYNYFSQEERKGLSLQHTEMWNSGVIGFNTGNKEVLTRTLAFMDKYYPSDHSIRVFEQFATSVAAMAYAPIKTAAPYLLHYWNLTETRGVLASFFNYYSGRPWQDLVKYSTLIQMYDLMLDKTRFDYNRTITEKLSNKPWTPTHYNWEQLESQL